MHKPGNASAGSGMNSFQRAGDVSSLEPCDVRRVHDACHMDYRLGPPHQPVERGGMRQIAPDPLHTRTRFLRAASQGPHFHALPRRFGEQRLANEAGRPGSRNQTRPLSHKSTNWSRCMTAERGA